MIEYKTITVPQTTVTIKAKELDGIYSTAETSMKSIYEIIESEAKAGWHLHSCSLAPLRIRVKLSIIQRMKYFYTNEGKTKKHSDRQCYMLVFQREAQNV